MWRWIVNLTPGLRERIADFLYPQPKVGIGVLVFNSGRVLLGERAKEIGRGSWQASGGHLEFMESFEDCALRELFEETNLIGINPRVVSVTNNPFPAFAKHYITVWVAVEVEDTASLRNVEATKCRGWQWFDFDDLPSPLFEASGVLTPDSLHRLSKMAMRK